ncbi:nucleoside hydrolase [Streptomyces sp. NPDC091267]|uniref:nucleoside hydrolase n=1 Tax=Streptomyces sp. NPDC091267 TaxID=3155195 RepID=UPI0034130B05
MAEGMPGADGRDVVIDADPGTDDAVGILIALGAPGLRLRAVTTVGGNAALDVVTDNALRLVDAAGCAVPVYRGAASPLDSAELFGHGALAREPRPGRDGDGLGLAPAVSRAAPGEAARVLCDVFSGPRGAGAVLVATGPLTNVAQALRYRPQLAREVRTLVVMGGSRAGGNATGSADFNFWADPVAAHAVLTAGFPDVVLFPLDTTRAAPVTESQCAAVASAGPGGRLAAGIIRSRMRTGPQGRVATVHDALCTAHLLAPVMTSSARCTVRVETGRGPERGTSYFGPAAPGGPGVQVATGADPAALVRVVTEAAASLSERFGHRLTPRRADPPRGPVN